MKAKQQYNILKKSGDLLEFYPELTGIWKEDEKQWNEIYNTIINGIVDFEVEEDE